MTQYFQIKPKHFPEISAKYQLEFIGLEFFENGSGNTNYLLRTPAERYVLTLFEIDYERAANLGKLMNLLAGHGFAAPRIQKSAAGELVTRWQGRPLMLKDYIPGDVVENLDDDQLSQMGTALAKLHRIPPSEYLPVHHDYSLETFPRLFKVGIDEMYEEWLAHRFAFLKSKIPAGLPRGMIHGDLFYDNVLFDGKALTAIIDFEDACHDYLVLDLGMAAVGSCCSNGEISLPKVRSLIRGYQNIRSLGDSEQESLLLFIQYAAIATSSWRFWKFNIDTPRSEMAQRYKGMAALAEKVAAISQEQFMQKVF